MLAPDAVAQRPGDLGLHAQIARVRETASACAEDNIRSYSRRGFTFQNEYPFQD